MQAGSKSKYDVSVQNPTKAALVDKNEQKKSAALIADACQCDQTATELTNKSWEYITLKSYEQHTYIRSFTYQFTVHGLT